MDVMNNSLEVMREKPANVSGFAGRPLDTSFNSRMGPSRSISPTDLVTGHRRIQTSTSLQMTELLTTSDFRASRMPLHKKITKMQDNTKDLQVELEGSRKIAKAVMSGISHIEVKTTRLCNELLHQKMLDLRGLTKEFEKGRVEDRNDTADLIKQTKLLEKQKCTLQEETYILAGKVKDIEHDIGLGDEIQ